jgi:hypothetical protein
MADAFLDETGYDGLQSRPCRPLGAEGFFPTRSKFMKNETAEILHFQIGTFNTRLGYIGPKRLLALQICLFLSSGRSLFWKELETVKAGDITQRNSHENVYPGSNPLDSYMVLMPSYRKKPLAECQHAWHPSQTSLNWNKWCLKRPQSQSKLPKPFE